MGIVKKQQNPEVKKHVATIHCANVLTLLQRKISNALLYHAYPNLNQKETHEITIKQLCNIIGYNGNNHAVIKDALKGLIACIIEWNVIDEKTGEEDWTASTMIASARIKGSQCSYSYSPHMRQLLYSPSMYGKINLVIQAKFRSSYGLALYENCIRYKGLPYTKWFDVLLFRKLMGVPADKYTVFRDFKKRVIDKAVEEINSYSDIIVEVEINRYGHKVVSIRFKLKEREKKQWLGSRFHTDDEEGVTSQQNQLIEKLTRIYGLTSDKIISLIEKYSEKVIQEKIELIELSNSYQQGKIKRLSPYLIKSLEDNYLPGKSSQEIQQASIKSNEENTLKKIKQSKIEEKKKQQYSKYVAQYIAGILSTYSNEELDEINNIFKLHLQNTNKLVLNRFLKNGLSSKMVYAYFSEFLKLNFPEKFRNMKSFSLFESEDLVNYSQLKPAS